MGWNEGKKTYVAGAAIAGYRVLQLDSGGVIHNTADAANVVLGFGEYGVKDGDDISVNLINCGGTVELEAAGAIAQGEKAFAAADGKIQALPVGAGTYRFLGWALEAAAGAGEIIEVMPCDAPQTVTVT